MIIASAAGISVINGEGKKQPFMTETPSALAIIINPRRRQEKIVTRSLEEGGSIGHPPFLLSTQFIRLT